MQAKKSLIGSKSAFKVKPPYIGAAYYPEDWPEEQVDEDVELMKQAGLNVVRMSEFAWSRLEPKEGSFEFDWLHRVIHKLASAGIATILGTPTAAPPIWLSRKHPEILTVLDTGVKVQHGARRHACPTNKVYRAYSRRIAEAMAQEFGTDPHVIGWQIDNEIYPLNGACSITRGCYCDACKEGFQEDLRRSYGSIEALNKAWCLTLFSMEFQSFKQVEPPRSDTWHHPSLITAWMTFQAKATSDFVNEQAFVWKRHTSTPVGTDRMPTNGMG